jgi:hypothetical protein
MNLIRLKLNWEKEYLKSISKGIELSKYMKEEEITCKDSDLLSPSTTISLSEFLNNKEIQKNKYLKASNDRSLSIEKNEKKNLNIKLKNDMSLTKLKEIITIDISDNKDIKIEVLDLIDSAVNKTCYPQSKYMPTLIEDEEEKESLNEKINKDYLKLFNLSVVQYDFICDFFYSYSKNNRLNKNYVHLALTNCVKHRKDFKKTLENEINRMFLNKNKTELEFNEFIEFICLFFAKKSNINSVLMSIMKNRYYNSKQPGFMDMKESNRFIFELFDFYGINEIDLIFNDYHSYESISNCISKKIKNFLYF